MADFEEIINTRRSIREYDSKEVENEKIEKILKAGMQAPGSRLGAEPWEFLIIKNKDTLAKIGETKPRVTNAPVAILLIANIERSFYKLVWQQDIRAAPGNGRSLSASACNRLQSRTFPYRQIHSERCIPAVYYEL